MTRKTLEALRDCTQKTENLTPSEEKIKEMLSFLSMLDRLSEICEHEGPSGLRLEADRLPESTSYEKTLKESIFLWLKGVDVNSACDHAAERYLEDNPQGYDSAMYFAAVYSIGNILYGEMAYGFIDLALQYLLPDGWRWREEDDKERAVHKEEPDWHMSIDGHRKLFIGDHRDEVRHRFDNVMICELIREKDKTAVEVGLRIAKKLRNLKDGALQLIMKELPYKDIEKALYVLPTEAEDRILSNISRFYISTIKGDCILNKDAVDTLGIRTAVLLLEDAIDSYAGDKNLEAGYEG